MKSQRIKDLLAKYFKFIDNAQNRHKWVINQISKIQDGARLLDAGAGECIYKPYCNKLNYVSQDFNEYDGKGDNVGLHTGTWDKSKIDIVCDVINIPQEDQTFDAVLCTEVLEHIPYPDKAITEFSRLLKSGGKLILTVPFCSQTHFAPFHFCTGFNYYWTKKVLEDNGFKILEYGRNGNFFDYVLQELIRTPLVVMNNSKLGLLALGLYLFILPASIIIYLAGLLTNDTEKQLFFGSFVLAEKL